MCETKPPIPWSCNPKEVQSWLFKRGRAINADPSGYWTGPLSSPMLCFDWTTHHPSEGFAELRRILGELIWFDHYNPTGPLQFGVEPVQSAIDSKGRFRIWGRGHFLIYLPPATETSLVQPY